MAGDSKKVVVIGALANGAIAFCKLLVGVLAHSSSLIAEGLHSVVDTGNSLLLRLGQKRGELPPDEQHPFGHGKELFFWTTTVSFAMFAVSGCAAIVEGIVHLVHPGELEDPKWTYIVISVAMVLAGYSFVVALKEFRKDHKKGEGFWKSFERARDPSKFMVVMEDGAEMVGLVIAGAAVCLSHLLKLPQLDAVGSILIGCLLCTMALLVGNENRKLLVGEAAEPELIQHVTQLTERHPEVERVWEARTMHMGPKTVLIAMGVEFRPDLKAEEIAHAVARLQDEVKQEHPEVAHLYLELRDGAHDDKAPVEEGGRPLGSHQGNSRDQPVGQP
ncbi:MAG: cation diffusion facilitator family transporter [Hyalangium sp.]|uniref:cation diffusion facilitator family transporter n=1 Tax=Hyalangium sp. TaxID=2028555 RepID=UPI00389A578F